MLLGSYAMEALKHQTPSPSRIGSPISLVRRESIESMSSTSACVFDTSGWDPLECLRFLRMLRKAFGWPIFRTAFALRDALDRRMHTEGRHLTPDERVVTLFCFAVHFNLCNQFMLWGFSVGATARELVAHLPRWNPMFAEHKPIPELWFQFDSRQQRREDLRELVFAGFNQDEMTFNRWINCTDEIAPLNVHLLWGRSRLDADKADAPPPRSDLPNIQSESLLHAVVGNVEQSSPLIPEALPECAPTNVPSHDVDKVEKTSPVRADLDVETPTELSASLTDKRATDESATDGDAINTSTC
jgi:hypothetical protein